MDNTVGSKAIKSLLTTEEGAYIFGLWSADGYYWNSSIGLSNTDLKLIKKFANFLESLLGKDRLRIRIYRSNDFNFRASEKIRKICNKIVVYQTKKARKLSYQLYVNSRPLVRAFWEAEGNLERLKGNKISPI